MGDGLLEVEGVGGEVEGAPVDLWNGAGEGYGCLVREAGG